MCCIPPEQTAGGVILAATLGDALSTPEEAERPRVHSTASSPSQSPSPSSCPATVLYLPVAFLIRNSNLHSKSRYDPINLMLATPTSPSFPLLFAAAPPVVRVRKGKRLCRGKRHHLRVSLVTHQWKIDGSCLKVRWIPPGPLVPTRSSLMSRAARQLSVASTSDRCLLSVSPGPSTICISCVQVGVSNQAAQLMDGGFNLLLVRGAEPLC